MAAATRTRTEDSVFIFIILVLVFSAQWRLGCSRVWAQFYAELSLRISRAGGFLCEGSRVMWKLVRFCGHTIYWLWSHGSCSRILLSPLVLCSAPSVPQPVFTITEKGFSWLKAPTSAFTFKTLLRHYAKRALTPR